MFLVLDEALHPEIAVLRCGALPDVLLLLELELELALHLAHSHRLDLRDRHDVERVSELLALPHTLGVSYALHAVRPQQVRARNKNPALLPRVRHYALLLLQPRAQHRQLVLRPRDVLHLLQRLARVLPLQPRERVRRRDAVRLHPELLVAVEPRLKETPLNVARAAGHADIVELLQQATRKAIETKFVVIAGNLDRADTQTLAAMADGELSDRSNILRNLQIWKL